MTYKQSNSNSDKILYLLKTSGQQTAAALAKSLKMTSMGARQHLQKLTDEGLIAFEDIKQGRGRPARYWKTTAKADERFPDTHSELTLQLLNSVEEIYGEQAITEIISARRNKVISNYKNRIKDCSNLAGKLHILAQIRSEEGYMANVDKNAKGYFLNENHCPICTAAQQNEGFCNSELELFRKVLGEQYQVDRVEHLLATDRRCSYQISINN